jgi:hypothetical protein
MKCRKCGRQLDFVSIQSPYFYNATKVKAVHKTGHDEGIKDSLVSPSYKRQLRRQLEAECLLEQLKEQGK